MRKHLHFPLQEPQSPADLIPGSTLAASVHFPDFLLCIIPEKVKEYDFADGALFTVTFIIHRGGSSLGCRPLITHQQR